MSTSNYKKKKKQLILNTVSVNLGCSSCKKPNLSKIFNPKPKPNKPPTTTTNYQNLNNNDLYYSSSTSSNKTNHKYCESKPNTSSPGQYLWDTTTHQSPTVRGFGRVGGESLAVEKESDDPYFDFRHSMLQMILEKEIYSKDDLKELLNCFLQLNSPYHHGIIIRAFSEIWDGVFSLRNNKSASSIRCNSRGF